MSRSAPWRKAGPSLERDQLSEDVQGFVNCLRPGRRGRVRPDRRNGGGQRRQDFRR
ncbi:MAG: hypothetical protein OJF58_001030 [Enhydrobacter sp.]|nr:MAG: hypothetical protein OJF58_001030 [Enhydrobacter sp.]